MKRTGLRSFLLLVITIIFVSCPPPVIKLDVLEPVITPECGIFTADVDIEISCATEGASIRYTTDGTTPTSAHGEQYSEAFRITKNTTVQAIAYCNGWNDSSVASSVYIITGTVADPVISPCGGTYSSAQSVEITCTTPGAEIRYTIDGSAPSETEGIVYEGPFTVPASLTVRAVSYLQDWETSGIVTSDFTITGTVAPPVFTPEQGSYTSPRNVEISCATEGASIRYTTNGTPPSETEGALYDGPVSVVDDMTIKAIAYRTGWNASSVAGSAYIITGTVADPVISPCGGTYSSAQSVEITPATPGAEIRYTIDGSSPSATEGIVYEGPFTVPASLTVRAVSYLQDWETSSIVTSDFTITGTVAPPVFTPEQGSYTSPRNVEISCATEGASIRYTTNGTPPSETEGTLYDGPVSVADDMTIKAIAFRTGWNVSVVAGSAYIITGTVADPVISPCGGTYSSAQSVEITPATPGAEIRYTIDGSTPSETEGIVYEGPFTVPASLTVRAVSYLQDWETSGIVASDFTITGTVEDPVITPAGGSSSSVKTVSVSSGTSGASIRYTLDGSKPTETHGLLYTAPFKIDKPTMVKVIAYKNDWISSNVKSSEYIITPFKIGDITYKLRQCYPDELEVKSCDKEASGEVTVLSEFYGFPVTAIGAAAFEVCQYITRITIPDSVKEIGRGAFLLCVNLVEAEIPPTVTSIGDSAFTSCRSLTSMKLPEGIDKINSWVFQNCSALTKIEIPSRVEAIGLSAFEESGLTKIIIPGTVKTIWDKAFYSCSSLTEIVLSSGLTAIEDSAFSQTGIEEITIPDTVTSLGSSIFEYCHNLQRFKLPANISEIPFETFKDCSSLSTVTLPPGIEIICGDAFSACTSLSRVVLSSGLKIIESRAFYDCTVLSEINIPGGVLEIRKSAFNNCGSISSINFPATLAHVGDYAFKDCSGLENIINTNSFDSINYLGEYAFGNCRKLTSFRLPERTTVIREGTFENCMSLLSMNLPSALVSIEKKAFTGCSQLAVSGALPANFKSIGASAFSGCTKLTNMILPESITSLGSSVFSACESLTDMKIPENITEVPNGCFQACTSLETVTLASGSTSIGIEAFWSCEKLKNINFPETLKTIGAGAFVYTDNLDIIKLPDSIEVISSCAFSHSLISTIDGNNDGDTIFPANLKEIGNRAFEYSGLGDQLNPENIILPEGLTTIGEGAFRMNSGIKSINIPAGVSRINDETFMNNRSLKDIFIYRLTAPGLGYNVIDEAGSCSIHIFPGASGYIGGEWDNLTIIEDLR